MILSVSPYKLRFKQPACTSRGLYTDRIGWYITADGVVVGECAPLPDLSADFLACGSTLESRCKRYEAILNDFLHCAAIKESFSAGALTQNLVDRLRPYPSILFGIESAIWYVGSKGYRSVESRFARSESPIIINGLVWMGGYDEMKMRMEEKLAKGFSCIKLKIGAIDFDKELALLEQIRHDFPVEKVTIRVDANGAFSSDDVHQRLHALSAFDIHSIEQPVRAGKWGLMAQLCSDSPVPIALDEDLIGINTLEERLRLLSIIKPQYIVIKPTLHGGITGTFEWIAAARTLGIGWWLTSALESNVGLTAIAHLCGILADQYPEIATLPQGLGTGALFTTNQPSKLTLQGDKMWHIK